MGVQFQYMSNFMQICNEYSTEKPVGRSCINLQDPSNVRLLVSAGPSDMEKGILAGVSGSGCVKVGLLWLTRPQQIAKGVTDAE